LLDLQEKLIPKTQRENKVVISILSHQVMFHHFQSAEGIPHTINMWQSKTVFLSEWLLPSWPWSNN